MTSLKVAVDKLPVHEKLKPPMKLFHSRESIYGIFVWFTIFALIVPYFLIRWFGTTSMIRYLPVIDLFANVLTNAGNNTFHNFFNDVYDVNANAYIDYVTMNVINVIALAGVAITILYETTVNKKNMRRGMVIAIAMFIMTYTLPTRTIGLVGQGARRWMARMRGTEVGNNYGWFGMLVAGIFAFILVMIEFTIITYLI